MHLTQNKGSLLTFNSVQAIGYFWYESHTTFSKVTWAVLNLASQVIVEGRDQGFINHEFFLLQYQLNANIPMRKKCYLVSIKNVLLYPSLAARMSKEHVYNRNTRMNEKVIGYISSQLSFTKLGYLLSFIDGAL